MSKILKLIFITTLLFSSNTQIFSKENFFNKALKLYEKEKYEDARFLFERSIVFNPKDANSYLYLAKIYNHEENQSKEEHNLECTILCDPDFAAYSAFGLSNFGIEQLLYDAPKETWCHSKEIGLEFQEARRAINRPLVDNPWLSPGEFLVDRSGIIRVSYTYQYCENFPDPRVFLTASKIF